MQITNVRISKLDSDKKVKAFASITIDDCFIIKYIRIIETADKTFVSMPSRQKNDGKFEDIAHPLNSDTRQMIEEAILNEYNK